MTKKWKIKVGEDIVAEFSHKDEAVMHVVTNQLSAEIIPPQTFTDHPELVEKVENLDRYIPKALDCYSAIAAKTSNGYLVRLDEVLELLYE